jgi:multidrug resistance efflux pump
MPEIRNKKSDPSPLPRIMSGRMTLLLIAAAVIFTALLCWFTLGTIRTSFTIYGVFTARSDATMIHQPQSGVITEIPVSTNQYVHQGDVLLKIFPEDESGQTLSLEEMKKDAKSVLSPVNGYITEIICIPWQRVDLTTTLMRLQESETPELHYAVAYVNMDELNLINVGTEAIVQVQGAEKENGGLISGRVTSISDQPVAKYEMLETTGSEEIMNYFYQENIGQYQLLIELTGLDEREADNRKNMLMCNEICKITLFSAEKHPYQVIFHQ